jgi:hypothetical protein
VPSGEWSGVQRIIPSSPFNSYRIREIKTGLSIIGLFFTFLTQIINNAEFSGTIINWISLTPFTGKIPALLK